MVSKMNKIINGDCVDIMKSMPDGSIDFVITSPPYDNTRTYKDNWTLDLHKVGQELFRVMKNGAMAIVIIQDQTKDFAKSLTTFKMTIDWCDKIGFKLFECCIWQKIGRPGAWWDRRFRVDHEYLLMFLKGDRPQYFNKSHMTKEAIEYRKVHGTTRKNDGSLIRNNSGKAYATKTQGTIFIYNNSSQETPKASPLGSIKLQHPATMPGKLCEDMIQCFTKPDMVVLDPFVGSGTACAAAKKLGRQYIGCDISKEYCDIAEKILSMVQNENNERTDSTVNCECNGEPRSEQTGSC